LPQEFCCLVHKEQRNLKVMTVQCCYNLQDRHHSNSRDSLYWGHGEKSHTLLPCTFPSNCYASTTSVLPYIPLLSFSYSVPKCVGSKNHTIAFSAGKLFGFSDTDKQGCKGTQQQASRWKPQLTSFPPTTGLFLLPSFSYEFPRH